MPKPNFHALRVKEVRQETPDCRSVLLDCPAELREVFQYKAGQYLTLRAQIAGKEVRRAYSLCSSPLDGELRVAVKRIEGGVFSTFANETLAEGDILDVMPPMGNFHADLSPGETKSYVAFAAGSGITPILSIIKTTLRAEPRSTFTLFYGNRNVASIIFKEEIEGLKNLFLERFRVYHFLTRQSQEAELFNGRFTPEKVSAVLDALVEVENTDDFFLCGPEAMIHNVREALSEREVPDGKIHFELFTASGNGKAPKAARSDKKQAGAGKICQVTIKDSGKSYQFDLPQGTQNLLDAALLNGADLPYACKGGVCCTCKAKLLEGKVDMHVNYALEPEEVAQGFILTCQSYPETESVVVDFDQAM